MKKCLLPCTALSVVKILEQCPGCYDAVKPVGKKLEGKIVTVINRSEIVGRPLAAMLANDGADVYSVDINSIFKLLKVICNLLNITGLYCRHHLP